MNIITIKVVTMRDPFDQEFPDDASSTFVTIVSAVGGEFLQGPTPSLAPSSTTL